MTDLEIVALSTNHRHKERIFRHKLSVIETAPESVAKDNKGCMMDALMMVNAVCILICPSSHFTSTISSTEHDAIDVIFEDGLDMNAEKEPHRGHQHTNPKKQLKKRRNIRIRKGSKICTYTTHSDTMGEHSREMLSPLSGRLLEINPRLVDMSTEEKMSLKGYVMAILPDNYVLNAVHAFDNGKDNGEKEKQEEDGEEEVSVKKKRKTENGKN